MILENVSTEDLARMLAPHMRKPAWPGLTDPKIKARAGRYAETLGMWKPLFKALNPDREISVVKRSLYREFARTGVRSNSDEAHKKRNAEILNAALLVWLDHPAADVDYLQDLIWATCERSSWLMTAHEGCTIDLGSSHLARLLAEVVFMLGDVLEDEVRDRAREEISRRALDIAHDWKEPDWWSTCHNNWNHVCNANLITAGLYTIDDSPPAMRFGTSMNDALRRRYRAPARRLAAFIHPLCRRLQYAINGFADDGGCFEGPIYWEYGFGHYLDAAVVLHHRTGGKLNIMHGAKIERICRYPLAANLKAPARTTFADSDHAYLSTETALKINLFYDMPELFELTRRRPGGAPVPEGWRALSLYRGERFKGRADQNDYFLPNLGQVTMRTGRGKSETVLAAIAGRNDVSHNHNDVGSFILFKKGKSLLTDPGAPRYTAKTFSDRRYEIVFCSSKGHSVPVINGNGQRFGGKARGTISVDGLNARGDKTAIIDMTRAYDDKTLEKLVRKFTLRKGGTVRMTDRYVFTGKPKAVEEVFITYETARTLKGGTAVRIGPRTSSLRLSAADTPGRFNVTKLVKESAEGKTGRILKRITFAPSKRAREMALTFEMT